MAWRRSDDKPLSESVMAKFNDAYMRVLGLNELNHVSERAPNQWNETGVAWQSLDAHVMPIGKLSISIPIDLWHLWSYV